MSATIRKLAMQSRAIIVFSVLVLVLMTLSACESATRKIASSAEDIRANSTHIAEATQQTKELAATSGNRFKGIGEETSRPRPDIQKIEVEASAGVAEQEQIVANSDSIIDKHYEIVDAVGEVAQSLTSVQDITPWWAKTLTYGLMAVSVIGIGFVLWYTGVGAFVRGVLGLVTPRARKEAQIAVAAMDSEDPTTWREFVAAKRGLDPEFDKAFRTEWKQHRETAAEQPPVSPVAVPEKTENT